MDTTDDTRRSTAKIVAITTACCVAIAAIAIALALSVSNAKTHSNAVPTIVTYTVTVVKHPTPKPAPVVPSAAVATVQRQLAQLNYYEGPTEGLWGPQTSAAVMDL